MAGSSAVTKAAPLALLDRNGSLVSIESYAPNIVRVTLGTGKHTVLEPPGYGISANPMIEVGNTGPRPGPPTQMQRYFAPSLPPISLTVSKPGGARILEMSGWEMAPHTVNGERTFRVGATFTAPDDEHYYGVGQNQEGILDYRGRTIDCKHFYDAPAGCTATRPGNPTLASAYPSS
jgi:alpha-D-xyloside xylohydrolase